MATSTYGATPSAPVTSVTIDSDTVYPTDIRYSDSGTSQKAAHMYDHKEQSFLTTNTKKLTISWLGPDGPTLSVGGTYTVTVTAGSTTITLTNAKCTETTHEASARGAWSCSASFELDEA